MKHSGLVCTEREDLDNLFPGAHALVYRSKLRKLEGPYIFIDKEGDTVCVKLPLRRKLFRSMAVKSGPPNSIAWQVWNTNQNTDTVDFRESRRKKMDGRNA